MVNAYRKRLTKTKRRAIIKKSQRRDNPLRLRSFKLIPIVLALIALTSVPGVYALWQYFYPVPPVLEEIQPSVNEFVYKPEGILYISNVEVISYSNGVSNLQVSYSVPTNFFTSANVTRGNTQITYEITVHNDTDVLYWYIGPKPDPELATSAWFGATNGITILTKDKQEDSSATFDSNDWVLPRSTRQFYVTYTYGSAATGNNISTLVDFQFGVKMDSVRDGFLAVLNDKTSEYGYNYLAQVFNEKYAKDGSMVIGNFGEEKTIFDNIFGKDLTIDVNGVPTPATVMIQRKDVDRRTTGDSYTGANAPSGCEYTLYITVDPLNSPTGQAIVYAISYTCDNTGANAGTWREMGQLYEGTMSTADCKNLNVSTWNATPNTYYITDDVYYKVGQQNGTNYDMLKTIEAIMSTDDRELYNKINGGNPTIFEEAYSILKANPNPQTPELMNLQTAYKAVEPYVNVYDNGRDIRLKDPDQNYRRSEILPLLVHLYEALEYYYQVHG